MTKKILYAIFFSIAMVCVFLGVKVLIQEEISEDIILVQDVHSEETLNQEQGVPIQDNIYGNENEIDSIIITPIIEEDKIDDEENKETKTPKKEVSESIIIINPSSSINTNRGIPNLSGEEQKIYKDGEIIKVTDIIRELPKETKTEIVIDYLDELAIVKRNEGKEKVQNFLVDDEEGGSILFEDLKGKPTVIVAWLTQDIDKLEVWQAIHNEYKEEINFLFINCMQGLESKEQISLLKEQKNYTLPFAYDTVWNFVGFQEIFTYPQTFFINSDGYVEVRNEGDLTEKKILKELESLLVVSFIKEEQED